MTYEEILEKYSGWNTTEPSAEIIQAAGSVVTARRLSGVIHLLQGITTRLDQLGTEGLHFLIRTQTRKVRKTEAMRRGKIAAKRRRTLAAKQAAAKAGRA